MREDVRDEEDRIGVKKKEVCVDRSVCVCVYKAMLRQILVNGTKPGPSVQL